MNNPIDLHLHEPDYGTGVKKLNIYVIGLTLCIILTLIPFATIIYAQLSQAGTFTVLFLSAILQFFVQVICFLRLNTSTEQSRINVLSFVFAVIILIAIVGGSLWVMWSLHYNMAH